MPRLGDFRHKPGTRLKFGYATKWMVLHLCAGMVRSGDATGGRETVAVVSLDTGQTSFEHECLEIREMRDDE